jgi:two-component sensor histidine kinase
MWGESRQAVMADTGRWAELVHPDDLDVARAGMPRVLAGEVHVAEYRIMRPSDGMVRWIRDTGFPIRDEEGRVRRAAGIAQDVTVEKRAEERQRLLLAELQHRVRNTLSVVRSIARRTAATSETTDDFAMHLDGRINAFARVQGAVTRDPDAGIDLEMLVAEGLLAVGAHEGEQVKGIRGPKVWLQPKAAETIALAIHELSTNALKYGALCAENGRIAVGWDYEGTDGQTRLVLRWIESGVRLSGERPERHGFGTELIERTIAYDLGGDATLEFDRDGLRCTISLPRNRAIFMAPPAADPRSAARWG